MVTDAMIGIIDCEVTIKIPIVQSHEQMIFLLNNPFHMGFVIDQMPLEPE
jgi:hypothetical protein